MAGRNPYSGSGQFSNYPIRSSPADWSCTPKQQREAFDARIIEDGKRMRILIADDNRLIRRGIAGLLSHQKSWVVCGEASDGTEAIQKAEELKPDLVLLDVSM